MCRWNSLLCDQVGFFFSFSSQGPNSFIKSETAGRWQVYSSVLLHQVDRFLESPSSCRLARTERKRRETQAACPGGSTAEKEGQPQNNQNKRVSARIPSVRKEASSCGADGETTAREDGSKVLEKVNREQESVCQRERKRKDDKLLRRPHFCLNLSP